MRFTADQTVSSMVGHADAMALVDWIEPINTMDAGQILINRLTSREAEVLERRIYDILSDPTGLPNGKNRREKLTAVEVRKFKSALIYAVEHAAVWAAHGPLPNRLQGAGRPPDNAVLLLIDDIIDACKASGLKPGLRYVAGSESLPVHLFIELAPLLWPGSTRAPRKLFERWQRVRPSLFRR